MDLSATKQTLPEKPEVTTVDWAEKLKASMDKTQPESEPKVNSNPHEDDDLAALLRAQLEKSSSDAFPTEIPDTSEFEELSSKKTIKNIKIIKQIIILNKKPIITPVPSLLLLFLTIYTPFYFIVSL